MDREKRERPKSEDTSENERHSSASRGEKSKMNSETYESSNENKLHRRKESYSENEEDVKDNSALLKARALLNKPTDKDKNEEYNVKKDVSDTYSDN